MINKSMGQVILTASEIVNEKEAVKHLQSVCTHPAYSILAKYWVADHPFGLPEGTPPLPPPAYPDDPWTDGLYQKAKSLYIFEKHGPLEFSKVVVRENKYIEFVKDLTEEDVKLLEWVKDGIFPNNLTRDVIKKAFKV